MANKSYDYIIVGSGAAGSIVAARLAADVHLSILLIEAGGSDFSVYVKMPAAMAYPVSNPKRIWDYTTGPEPHLDNRHISHVRGRMLGGSTSLNGMVFVRGNKRDYDGWAAQGLPGWDYAHCLPYFKRLETFNAGANAYRGGEGPIKVTTLPARLPVFQAFLRAGREAGYKVNPDYNAAEQDGLHIGQANIENGIRGSTSRQYLRPAMTRGTITLMTGALVNKVVFDGKRAVGVEFTHRGETLTIHADREVILCGGSINSPQLLLLSGIGAPDDLRTHGIPVVAAVPGVGQNLQDHVSSWIRYRTTRPGISPVVNITSFGKLRIGLEWMFFRSGLGTSHLWEVGTFFKSSDNIEYCNIQHEFLPMITEMVDGKAKIRDGFQYLVCLMRPSSRGRVALTSSNPRTHPSIVFNYLSTPEDRQQMMAAMRTTDEIIQQPAWDDMRGEALEPGIRKMDDAKLMAYLRQSAGTQYHPSSTCRMGVDDLSVVDGEGRVHGVDNLRVIDASILPAVTSGNISCPTMMVAEKLSDAVLGRPLLPAERPS